MDFDPKTMPDIWRYLNPDQRAWMFEQSKKEADQPKQRPTPQQEE